MLKRLLLSLLVVVAILVAIGIGESASASSRKHCTTSQRYGSMCVTLYGHDLTATDVIGSFQLPVPVYLGGTTWRFALTSYQCDPRGVSKQQCAPDATHLDPSRTGPPPGGTAYAYASHGDLASVPLTVRHNQWVCVEIARRSGSRWVDNGGPQGLRACGLLHS